MSAMSSLDEIDILTKKYNLKQHPEGGFYAETYRSSLDITIGADRVRSASTAIYFLIRPGNISRMHRIQSDEMWHFYLGNPTSLPSSISFVKFDPL
jgi:uncharacterized protein